MATQPTPAEFELMVEDLLYWWSWDEAVKVARHMLGITDDGSSAAPSPPSADQDEVK